MILMIEPKGRIWLRNIYKTYNIYHREGGPAAEWNDGEKWWCREGGLHRRGSPAVERGDGWPENFTGRV